MPELPPRLTEILEDLSLLPDRQEKIDYLISLAGEFTNPGPELPRTSETRVPGCESEVYVAPVNDHLRIAVDNPQGISAMALAAALEESLNGATQQAIESVQEDIVYRIFGTELSMGKSMGLTGIVRMSKEVAKKLATRS